MLMLTKAIIKRNIIQEEFFSYTHVVTHVSNRMYELIIESLGIPALTNKPLKECLKTVRQPSRKKYLGANKITKAD